VHLLLALEWKRTISTLGSNNQSWNNVAFQKIAHTKIAEINLICVVVYANV